MNGRSVTQIIGIDVQGIYMTMLGLVALYLILTHAKELNALVVTSIRGGVSSLAILQGRNPRDLGLAAV